ncbi:MAG: hypothetical protein ABW275_00570, partial [Hansschlegelia sp.]
YPEYLKLEYPMSRGSLGEGGWLPPSALGPASGSAVSRAYAKAVYGRAYYGGERPLSSALRRFGAQVEAARAQAIVCVVFSLAESAASGMVVDLARHLSNVVFGRQALTVGVGVLPDEDDAQLQGGALYAALNELDCLGDEDKNEGVVAACGQLFRNPFTAGLIVVPQMRKADGGAAGAQPRATEEISTLLAARDGANLWEALRLLNWVAAPSTQHSAARTPWGRRWIHMLGYADASGGSLALDAGLPARVGLLPSFRPEFIELRVASPESAEAADAAAGLQEAFGPDVPPQIADGGREGSVQFILPSIAKTDLALFYEARSVYEASDEDERVLDHSLLLDQGVLVSEPSTRLEGMAGASLPGSDGWIAVSFSDLRGGAKPPAGARADRAA